MAETDRAVAQDQPYIEDTCEQLFLLEVLVDKIDVKTEGLLGAVEKLSEPPVEDVEEEEEEDEDEDEDDEEAARRRRRKEAERRRKRRKKTTRPIKVNVTFFDFPTIEIDESDFTERKEQIAFEIDLLRGTGEEADDEEEEEKAEEAGMTLEEWREEKERRIQELAEELQGEMPAGMKFCSGKSCLFPIIPLDLVNAIKRTPLKVQVHREGDGDQPPRLIGLTNIALGDNFIDAITIASTPAVLPVSAFLDGPYELKNVFGEVTAVVHLYVRISCFGSSIFTQFKLKEGEDDYLFKISGNAERDAEQLKKGRKTDYIPKLTPSFTKSDDFKVGAKAPIIHGIEPSLKPPVSWRKKNENLLRFKVFGADKLHKKPIPKPKYRKTITPEQEILEQVIPGFGRQIGDPEFFKNNPTIPRMCEKTKSLEKAVDFLKRELSHESLRSGKKLPVPNVKYPGTTLPCQFGMAWPPFRFPLPTQEMYPPLSNLDDHGKKPVENKVQEVKRQRSYCEPEEMTCSCPELAKQHQQRTTKCNCHEKKYQNKYNPFKSQKIEKSEYLSRLKMPLPRLGPYPEPREPENDTKECLKNKFPMFDLNDDKFVFSLKLDNDYLKKVFQRMRREVQKKQKMNVEYEDKTEQDTNQFVEKVIDTDRQIFFDTNNDNTEKQQWYSTAIVTERIINRHRMGAKKCRCICKTKKGEGRAEEEDNGASGKTEPCRCICSKQKKVDTMSEDAKPYIGIVRSEKKVEDAKQRADLQKKEDKAKQRIEEERRYREAKAEEKQQRRLEALKKLKNLKEARKKYAKHDEKESTTSSAANYVSTEIKNIESLKGVPTRESLQTDGPKMNIIDKVTKAKQQVIKPFKKPLPQRREVKQVDVKTLQKDCPKDNIKYIYTEGLHPISTCGHQTCKIEKVRTPANRGWLWNFYEENLPKGKVDMSGWKSLHESFTKIKKKLKRKVHDEEESSKVTNGTAGVESDSSDEQPAERTRIRIKKDEGSKIDDNIRKLVRGETRPTLHVHKTDGKYNVIMFPAAHPLIRSGTSDKKNAIIFTFNPKHPDGSPTDSCDDLSSSISDDSVAIDFTSPLSYANILYPAMKYSHAIQTNPYDSSVDATKTITVKEEPIIEDSGKQETTAKKQEQGKKKDATTPTVSSLRSVPILTPVLQQPSLEAPASDKTNEKLPEKFVDTTSKPGGEFGEVVHPRSLVKPDNINTLVTVPKIEQSIGKSLTAKVQTKPLDKSESFNTRHLTADAASKSEKIKAKKPLQLTQTQLRLKRVNIIEPAPEEKPQRLFEPPPLSATPKRKILKSSFSK